MSTAIATKQNNAVAEIREYLDRDVVKKQLALVLPRHMTPDRMVRLALSCAGKNNEIAKSTPLSIAKALQAASEMGLEPDGRHGYLVAYKNNKEGTVEAQFIPGYMGYVKLAYQSGMVKSCMARAVRAKDLFNYKYGTGSFLEHTPADLDDRGELTHAWAMVELKDGGAPFIVLNKAEVTASKKKSKSASSPYSPWNEFPDAMWAKTAFRALSKFIPLSSELSRAIQAEDDVDLSDLQPMLGGQKVTRSELNDAALDVESTEPASALTSLADAFAGCQTTEDLDALMIEIGTMDDLAPEDGVQIEKWRKEAVKRLKQ